MPIPAHERIPAKGISTEEYLKRLVQVGQMMVSQSMTVTEIFQWNTEAHGDKPAWGMTIGQISKLCKAAREMGASLLFESYEEAQQAALREWAALKRQAMSAGDYRVAYMCVREMQAVRGQYHKKTVRGYVDPVSNAHLRPAIDWSAGDVTAQPSQADTDPAAEVLA